MDEVEINLDMEEYELDPSEVRHFNRRKLSEINSAEKALKQERKNIIISMSDPEKRDRLRNVVRNLHRAMLEKEGSFADIIESSVSTEDVLFFLDNKHDKFTYGVNIFEEFIEHHIQKKLVSGGFMSKRDIKKQKSPYQHLKCVFDSNSDMRTREDLENMKKSIAVSNSRLAAAEAMLNTLNSEIEDRATKAILNTKEWKKMEVVMLKMQNPNFTNVEISKITGVPRPTIIRWLKK